MTPDEVRAVVRSWPELLADRFRDFLSGYWDDESIERIARIIAYLTRDALAPLEVLVDVDDALAAKLEVILNYVEAMEEQHPMTDTTPNERGEPPDRSIPAIYRLIQRDEGDAPLGGWGGERNVRDRNRVRPPVRFRSASSPFPPPPWSDQWTPGCDE